MKLNNSVHIQHLRIRSESDNATAARLLVERLLSTADLGPPGMPLQAVMIVRRMDDPQPGGMATGLGAARVRSEWERQARERLAELYRRAARPALGAVPPGAEAVVFAEESELLACLLLDVRRELVPQHWWWRGVIRWEWGVRSSLSQQEMARALAQHMARQAHLVPATLARFQDQNRAADALLALTPEQASQVLHAVLRAYRLPDLLNTVGRVIPAAANLWEARPRPGGPEWEQASQSMLGRERASLLGLAYDLHSRPQEVRTPGYQRRLRAWWRAAPALAPPYQAGSPKDQQEGPDSSRKVPGLPHRNAQAAVPDIAAKEQAPWLATGDITTRSGLVATSGPSGSSSQESRNMLPHEFMPNPTPAVAARPPDSSAPGSKAYPPPVSAGPGPLHNEEHTLGSDRWTSPEAAVAALDRQLATWLGGGVATQLGGVLYLINLMVFLDLPDCFEDNGWRLVSRVGAWGLLEALGRELLGGEIAGSEDDPLWVALAQLDGRAPGQPPGLRLPRTRPRRWPAFRLPDAWRAGLPDREALVHGDKPGRQVPGPQYAPLLKRWLALALPFIRYRLRLALGLPGEVGLAEHLLRVPARLYVTSAHVDLVASVNAISLPVRLAGLDRDPGWLPGFGRVVYFHFE